VCDGFKHGAECPAEVSGGAILSGMDRTASLPTYRYPTPFPVPNQGWHATIEADQAIVRVRVGDARCRLWLKTWAAIPAADGGLPTDCQRGSCCRRIGDPRSCRSYGQNGGVVTARGSQGGAWRCAHSADWQGLLANRGEGQGRGALALQRRSPASVGGRASDAITALERGSEVRAAASTGIRSAARGSGTEVPRPHEFGDT